MAKFWLFRQVHGSYPVFKQYDIARLLVYVTWRYLGKRVNDIRRSGGFVFCNFADIQPFFNGDYLSADYRVLDLLQRHFENYFGSVFVKTHVALEVDINRCNYFTGFWVDIYDIPLWKNQGGWIAH